MARIKGLILVLLCVAVAVSGGAAFTLVMHNNNQQPYTYLPSEDFYNLSISFAGNGATSRAFSFMTDTGVYENKCVVQLDPSQKQDTEPSFNSRDNFYINAVSNSYILVGHTAHKAYTQDLTADTKYFYRVGSPTHDSWSEWGYFITDDGDGSFTFLHVTDLQASGDANFAATADILNKATSHISGSEFLFSTGDQFENGFLFLYESFFSSYKATLLSTTFAAVNGNHEVFASVMYDNFYVPTDITSYYYAYEYGDCLFIVLDTNIDLEEQFVWAKELFSKSTKKWRIIGQHHSPYSTGTHADDALVVDVRHNITQFAAQSNIDLVLSGHDHIYARTYPVDSTGSKANSASVSQTEANGYLTTVYTQPQGTIYVSNRCAGTKFYSKVYHANDHLIAKGDQSKIQVPMYSAVTIQGNKLTYTAYEYYQDTTKETAVYDCFQIIK